MWPDFCRSMSRQRQIFKVSDMHRQLHSREDISSVFTLARPWTWRFPVRVTAPPPPPLPPPSVAPRCCFRRPSVAAPPPLPPFPRRWPRRGDVEPPEARLGIRTLAAGGRQARRTAREGGRESAQKRWRRRRGGRAGWTAHARRGGRRHCSEKAGYGEIFY